MTAPSMQTQRRPHPERATHRTTPGAHASCRCAPRHGDCRWACAYFVWLKKQERVSVSTPVPCVSRPMGRVRFWSRRKRRNRDRVQADMDWFKARLSPRCSGRFGMMTIKSALPKNPSTHRTTSVQEESKRAAPEASTKRAKWNRTP